MKPMINEIFVLRSIACLCVVAVHAIAIGLTSMPTVFSGEPLYFVFDSINILLYFGTPLFIFISEFLIAYSYKEKKLPDKFMRKRFAFLYLPFLFMALFYSIPYMTALDSWSLKLFLNIIIGDYHGYFILIIFQFYLLHLLFHKHLKKWSPKIVLPISFMITFGYLVIFNFTTPLGFSHATYVWDRFYWVPFLGWLFYFTLGFYCGHHYQSFISLLKKYNKTVLVAPIFTSISLLLLYHTDLLIVHSSKRIDMLLHTTAICFFLFYIGSQIKKIPPFLIYISKYSFGIYLLHYFYISVLDFLYQVYPINIGIAYIFILFGVSIYLSIVTVNYCLKWQYGKYIVGKIGVGIQSNPSNQESHERVPQKRYVTST
ncbi:acyltransferase family protein [Evansella sp. AB-rgal1]|uniref:acyltransferase family protein n=1 Tax=Evansella sp. AB-rgal1 TaxID=3242696 RepID=UPI00359DE265